MALNAKRPRRRRDFDRTRDISLYHRSPLGPAARLTKDGGSTDSEGTASSLVFPGSGGWGARSFSSRKITSVTSFNSSRSVGHLTIAFCFLFCNQIIWRNFLFQS